MSPTMKVAAEAERLRRQGVDIVDLGAGEPDFPTPPHIIEAGGARSTQTSPSTRPTSAWRSSSAAICERYRTDYGIKYSPADVIITAGGKQALYNARLRCSAPATRS